MAWSKICCATDFSAQSRSAMREAARLAEREGARLTLLHVAPPPVLVEREGTPPTI